MELDLKTPQEPRQDSVAPEVDGLQAGFNVGNVGNVRCLTQE